MRALLYLSTNLESIYGPTTGPYGPIRGSRPVRAVVYAEPVDEHDSDEEYDDRRARDLVRYAGQGKGEG